MDPMEVMNKFKGFQLQNARGIAEAFGWEIRVMREDGEDPAGTADFNPRRVNVEVNNGIITQILGIG